MGSDIHIEKHAGGESFIKIKSEDSGILMELSEAFTFFVPGYQYMPSYKNKMFDGKIRMFDRRTGLMASGLLMDVCKFCNSRGYSFKMSSEITSRKIPSEESIREYINSLTICDSNRNPIEPRDYQMDAIIRGIRNAKSLLISPTGSGKSLIIYLLLRWWLDHGDHETHPNANKVLIIVPTTSLVLQMKGDFADYSFEDCDFNAQTDVHEIFSGKEKMNINSSVVITTWQSAIRLPASWFSQFGMVIGDEAHQAKCKSFLSIMSHLTKAQYRIGTTGTTDGINVNELTLIGNFGPKYVVTRTKDLIDSKTLAELKIKCLVFNYPKEVCKAVSKADYPDEVDYIVKHKGRNNFIKNLSLTLEGNTLIIYNYVGKHGKPLFDMIKKANKDSTRPIFFVSGAVSADERETVRLLTDKMTGLTTINDKVKIPNGTLLSNGKVASELINGDVFTHNGLNITVKTISVAKTGAIIVASAGTFAAGINIKNIHNIIFASPFKSQIRVMQSIGRGLRKSENGKATTLYDLSDNFKSGKKGNYTLNHARVRVEAYEKESFKYTVYEIPEFYEE